MISALPHFHVYGSCVMNALVLARSMNKSKHPLRVRSLFSMQHARTSGLNSETAGPSNQHFLDVDAFRQARSTFQPDA